jgi:hypothetical protein
LVCEELFGGKSIRIFEFGFIQIVGSIEGLFGGDNAPFEKLLSVSSSYGHKGDDAYLVVVTEIKTHTLIGNVGTKRGSVKHYDYEIRSMHALTATAKAVLEHPGPRELSRSGLADVSTDAKTSTSIADEITKLVKLRDSGALTDERVPNFEEEVALDNIGQPKSFSMHNINSHRHTTTPFTKYSCRHHRHQHSLFTCLRIRGLAVRLVRAHHRFPLRTPN